jgi:hypothetical protein
MYSAPGLKNLHWRAKVANQKSSQTNKKILLARTQAFSRYSSRLNFRFPPMMVVVIGIRRTHSSASPAIGQRGNEDKGMTHNEVVVDFAFRGRLSVIHRLRPVRRPSFLRGTVLEDLLHRQTSADDGLRR